MYVRRLNNYQNCKLSPFFGIFEDFHFFHFFKVFQTAFSTTCANCCQCACMQRPAPYLVERILRSGKNILRPLFILKIHIPLASALAARSSAKRQAAPRATRRSNRTTNRSSRADRPETPCFAMCL